MKVTFKIILAALLMVSSLNAQEWTRMMQDTGANFYDIVKEFDNYWKDKPYERGKGYKAFKRWQWFMSPRVYPTGNLKFGSRGYALEQYNKFLQENSSNKFSANAVISATTSNWTPLGPFGSPTDGDAGRIQTIKMHPAGTNTFYVGTAAGGFWMTNNGGTSYTTTTDQLGSCGVSDIAISSVSPNIIYISTGDKDAGDTHSTGVLKSTDGGLTWNTTGLQWLTSQQIRVYRLLIHPVNPDILIAATSIGMYRTADAGLTWSVSANGGFVDAEFRPGDPNTVHAVTPSSYFKSTDGGVTYNSVVISNNLSSNRLSLAVTPANDNYVYIVASFTNNGFGGLYRSTDAGNSFTLRSSSPNIFDWSTNGSGSGGQGWYDIAIDASPTNANEIIAGGVNTWKSTNGGTSWTLNTHWYGGGGKPYVHADLHQVLYTSGTTCFLGTDGGVARTTNSGANWTTINGNMNIAQVYKIGISATNPARIVSGHQDNGTNLSNGTNWSRIYGGDGMDCFIDWNNNNTIIASYVYGDFQRSFNGGNNWTNITSGLTGNGAWLSPIVQSPTDPNTYYCGYQHVFKSTNQGGSWTQLGSIGSTLDEIKVSPSNTNVIYATSSLGVFKTTNGGNSWISVTGSLPTGSAQIEDLAIDNQNPNNVYVTLSGYSSGNKVYFSNTGGNNWTNYSTGLPNIPINCVVFKNNSPQALYVGTDLGVYYREASMSSWIPYNNGLPNIVVTDLEIYYPTGKLRAATYARGVWETDLFSNPNAAPNAAFSTQYVSGCINLPLQFNDLSANTPTSWNWTFSGGTPATSTLQNPTSTFPTAGIYTVTLISANVNGTSTAYMNTVSVVNAPTVSAINSSICVGQTAQLNLNTNGTDVVWSTGQQGLFISVTPLATTVYDFTTSLGACNTAGSTTLSVLPALQTPVVVNMGSYLTTTAVAVTYQWYLNGSAISGATTASFTPTESGFYSVWIGNGGCLASSTPINITPIGINEISFFNGVTVGPNPAKDQISVTFENSIGQDVEYKIENNLGQLIMSSSLKTDGKSPVKINVQSLSAGIYYLNLSKGNNRSSYKFIKQ